MAWLCIKGGKKAGDVATCIQWLSLGARHSAGPGESEDTEARGAEGDAEHRALGLWQGLAAGWARLSLSCLVLLKGQQKL